MTVDEIMRDPHVKRTMECVLQCKVQFEELHKYASNMRSHIIQNRDADPAAAARLIDLLDQRLEILIEMTACADRMFGIIASAGQISRFPAKELSSLVEKISVRQMILKHLIEESIKIVPGSGAGPKTWMQ